MKRQSGRDTGRRVRGSPDMLRPGSRERMSPGNDRYEGRGGSKLGRASRSMEKDDRRDRDGGRRSGNFRGRGRGGGNDDRERQYGGDYRGGYDRYDNNKTYTSLRLTGFPSHVADMAIKDALYHEFKKFGDVNIRITYSGPNEDRTAFANFRAHDHAREAKMAKGDRITLFAKSLRVDCVFKSKKMQQQRRSQSPDMGYGGRMPPSNMGGGRRPQQGGMQKGMGRDGAPGRDRNFMYNNDRRQCGNDNFNSREHDRERELMLLPEDDPKATRTVFVGNLEDGISESEIKRSFERYGIIEDIDIKYPPRNQGNPFAFVRYLNLDMAHKAMVAMSGQYIGRNQCKTGYGKLSPTSRLWIGGLGPWVSLGVLEREFDRFGAIRKIDYVKGDTFAYVQYETLEAAQVAANNMRGFPLGGPDRRLRVDFAEPDTPTTPNNKSPFSAGSGGFQQGGRRNDQGGGNFDREFGGGRSPPAQYRENWVGDNGGDAPRRGGEWQGGNGRYPEDWNRKNNSRDRNAGGPDRRGKRGGSPGSDFNERTPERTRPFKRRRSPSANQARSDRSFESPERGSLGNRDSSPDYHKRHRSSSEDGNDGEFADQRRRFQKGNGRKDSLLHGAETLVDLVKHLDLAWQGYVVLKNSAFATRMFQIGGDTSLADSLLPHGKFDGDGILRITQRLRLDQPKLEEVGKRISGAGSSGHCLMLALPGDDMPDPAPSGTQSRALRNLVSYLQQKQAAGVISLPVAGPKEADAGVLHAFPPCEFSQKHLLNHASGLGTEPSKEDHLVVIVVRGAAFTTSG